MEKNTSRLLHYVGLCILVGIIMCLVPQKARATELLTDNQNGVLTISYNNADNAKMKVVVTKEAKSYYYDLYNGENSIDIPLTMGNGTYSIRIAKNITDNKYSIVATQQFDLELTDETEVYLHPNVIVNYDIDYAAIKKAAQLTKNAKTEAEKVKLIYNYVLKYYSYDYDKLSNLSSGYIPDIKIIYTSKKGICYDISAIIASMLRSQGVHVRLVTGYTPNISVYHAWNMIYDSKTKKWYTVDATYDIGMKAAGRKYTMKKKADDYKDVVYQY